MKVRNSANYYIQCLDVPSVPIEKPAVEPKRRVVEEKVTRIRELCRLLLEEKTLKLDEMNSKIHRFKKLGKSHSRKISRRRITFPESFSDEEDSPDSPHYYERHSVPSLDKSSLETSFRVQKYTDERKDKFFSDLLVELSSKSHPHEITSVRSSNANAKDNTDIYSLVGCFKILDPQTQNTSNAKFNEILVKVRESKKQEMVKLIAERKEAEEKARKEREAQEAERKRLEEAKRKQEEEAKKKAMEEEAKRRAEEAKRQEEEKKRQLAQQQQQQEQARLASAAGAPGAAPQGAATGSASQAAPEGSQGSERHMFDYMRTNLEMSDQEIQELQQMKNSIVPIREALASKGIPAAQAVIIVNIKNVPSSWTTEIAKQKLTELQRKFTAVKAEVKNGTNNVMIKVVGFDDAVKYLLLKNLGGFATQIELRLSENQVQGQPTQQTQGQLIGGQAPQVTNQRPVVQIQGTAGQQPGMMSFAQGGQNMFQSGGQQQQRAAVAPIGQTAFGQSSQINKPQSGFGQTSPFGQSSQLAGAGAGKPTFGQSASFGQSGGTQSTFGQTSFGQTSTMGQTGMSQMSKPAGFGGFGGAGQQVSFTGTQGIQ